MMNGLNSIRKERASLERDRVIFGSMLEDAAVDEGLTTLSDDFFEGVSEDEIEDLISKIPESDEDDEQVDRILASDDDGLDVDGILGVDADDNL